MIRVAKMLREHVWGILNAISTNASKPLLESTNPKIQALEKCADTETEIGSVMRFCSTAVGSTYTLSSRPTRIPPGKGRLRQTTKGLGT